ncbi:MAG: translation elongation factor EF-1 subunit alpha [Candidatus Thermoplasmatota archaeon]|nr:translation elongation factor EF-1 subunit alpha [Euryarchaeota archaeon]MBU4032963.1 translation elongation factor EF-1 subunit alpha [Candidatus Thermoplasmatota archaeon]MBU4071970.1 translation elongation factor EF-1 subunit alpha [Candidatus Thermoplasmatota archaeon]MBU4144767.1 translation elongation factor EF-1 subunit alpha [Candidatus Thermoplasmatota archaeon]MBU4591657.1 translation elongation factor EF-1 subunit alpha [Candidatus Thermoplasmatota archaeon]
MAEKPHMNIVFIGHVDHGKSTLVGRTLLDTGTIEQHLIDKYRKEAESMGKASFEFAWVMDGLKEERERGVTIDVAHKRFDTDKYYFTVIDAPGHRDFVKNMITGTSQADAAVLVVSGEAGVMAQTREHVFLARTLGVTQVIVAINKMDATQPPYDEGVYNKVKAEVTKLMKSVGYRDDMMQFLPVSAIKGDNAAKPPTANMPWYKGLTLIAAMDTLKEPLKATTLPLRWPIQDVYTITGVGTVPVGRVETGIIKPEMKIIFMPANKVGEVKSVEMHHQEMAQAGPGDNVGCNIRGVAKNDIRRGDVAGPVSNPPMVAKTFEAQIMVLNHPSVLTVGYTPVFHLHTAQVACTFIELKKKLDPKTGATLEENPQFLKTGDAAIVKIQPTKPLVIETAKDFPQLGRFAIRDMGQTVAAGVCISVEKKEM